MSTALAPQDHEMVVRARGLLAQHIEADVAIGQARALAATVKGLVVTTAAESAAVVDTAVSIAAGIRAVDAKRKAVLEIPRAVEAAVNGYANTILAELKAAQKSCNDASAGYLIRQRQEQERELARQREQAARDAAQEAAETGEETVPLEAPAEIKPQTMVRGTAGSQGLVETLKCAWDNPPHPWAILNEAAAKDWFRAELKAGRIAKPVEAYAIHHGVRFYYEISVATRRA